MTTSYLTVLKQKLY